MLDITHPQNYCKDDPGNMYASILLRKSKLWSPDVVDVSYFIAYTSNLDKAAPRETLFYLLHKDQDYTELSIVVSNPSQASDEKIAEKFKQTKRQVDIYPTENSKENIFTTSIHRFKNWVIISGWLS
jgi:hypothetical protein